MTIYIKLATGEYPTHQGDVRVEYPEMGDEFILPETYAFVRSTMPPEHDYVTQRPIEIYPVLLNGEWVMQWDIRDATQEEIDYASDRNTNGGTYA